jgi:LysM repeat protein
MKFKYKTKISLTSIMVNLVVVTGFFYLMLNADKFSNFSPLKVQAYSNNLAILKEEIPDDSTINPSDIYIDDNLPGVVYYIVQPGDTLSKIAANFGVTVSHLKKINKLSSDIIKPGDKLTITDQDGFVYVAK